MTLSSTHGGACRWLLSPSLPHPTDLSLDLRGMRAGDVLQLRLPHGLTVLLWPGMAGGVTTSDGGSDGTTWFRTVDAGEILLELGRAVPTVAANAAAAAAGGSSSSSSSNASSVQPNVQFDSYGTRVLLGQEGGACGLKGTCPTSLSPL